MSDHGLSADELQLEALGHKGELKRQFSFLSMLGLAFAILNSWTALSTSLSLALPSGGSTSVIWGLITAGICNLCLAASLAEFLSAYPTAGGQYHWVAVISWKGWVASLSWICGWINCFGWIALTATGGLLGSQLIVGIIYLESPGYEAKSWHQFLIYIGYNIFAFLVNAFANSSLPHINKAAISWSIAGFAIICITVLACTSPNYSSGEFVFAKFINTTGWPDGVAWLLGLLQGGLGVTGYDAVAHMIEEIPNASVQGPKIMIYCVAIGTFTGFVFLVCLLLVPGDIDSIINSSATPLLQIIFNATNSHAGSICLLMFPLVCLLFATTSIMTTSSRMVYAFARDGGLPFSKLLGRVHRGLDVPLNALIFSVAWVIIFGCVFLGSSSAFNAITSASVVALGISYGMPIAVNCLRGRKMLPPRSFTLPEPIAWTLNLIGLAYVLVTTVLFVFPPEIPVSGSSMNYCIVVFAIVVIISGITWIVDGRKNYAGPTLDMGIEVIEARNMNAKDVDVAEFESQNSKGVEMRREGEGKGAQLA
ncbi:amino acid transporter [Saccharata proteae CBS 121410]|uniref:Amino acid transporter n=1 Tax=Saccharata proteae CBS 121410 TaxID=1314787 RepID=A0A9P4HSA9_9PEZI|nr:amino acid transporter [Saccharata proteae CBS 121410]